ncbi:unnamed protein product [Thelazia callipaeda]|uniref:BPI1 domain-containing protein n=1 Tax=Thelazia callipaeda TaxID=103827 RepID=A0A0N5D2M4_THECL|nr:unnamed protein product [Thelazia callipaeda]
MGFYFTSKIIAVSTVLYFIFVVDTDEALHSTCLAPAAFMQEQKVSDISDGKAFLKDNSEVFVEFSQQTDSERGSSVDETMSLATNISEEEQLMMFDAVEDDIFGDEIAMAEEAIPDNIAVKSSLVSKYLKKKVNIVCVVLKDLNVVASALNSSVQGVGYVTEIAVQQFLNKKLTDVYASMSNQKAHTFSGKTCLNDGKAIANFHFWSSSNKQPLSVDIQVEGFRASLDNIIVMHLPAFISDDVKKNDIPLNLKINLINTEIVVKDPETRPVRIKLNDCVIEQVVEEGDTVNNSA